MDTLHANSMNLWKIFRLETFWKADLSDCPKEFMKYISFMNAFGKWALQRVHNQVKHNNNKCIYAEQKPCRY
jgi:hypothetical protein